MLRCEDRRGHQHGDLRSGLDGLEGRPQSDLGLAVADVADDEPVHGRVPLEVGLHVDGRLELVRGLLVGKRRLHLGLPGRVLTKRSPSCLGPVSVEAQEVTRKIADRLLDPGAGTLPLPSSELAELRMVTTRIAGDAFDLLDRDPDAASFGEVQLEVVALLAAARRQRLAADEALVACDAMVDMDHHVTGLESLQQVARHDPSHGLGSTHADGPEQLPVGDHDEAVGAPTEAPVEAAIDEGQPTGRDRLMQSVERGCPDVAFLEDLREPCGLV